MSAPAQTLELPHGLDAKKSGAIAAPESAAAEHFRVLLQRIESASRPAFGVALTTRVPSGRSRPISCSRASGVISRPSP